MRTYKQQRREFILLALQLIEKYPNDYLLKVHDKFCDLHDLDDVYEIIPQWGILHSTINTAINIQNEHTIGELKHLLKEQK